MNPIYEQIKSVVFIKDNPEFAGFDPVKKVLWVTFQVSGALVDVYDSLRGDPARQEQLAEALELLYADYIEPIDLPIGDFVERIVDRNVASFIKPMVQSIDAALDKKLPTAE